MTWESPVLEEAPALSLVAPSSVPWQPAFFVINHWFQTNRYRRFSSNHLTLKLHTYITSFLETSSTITKQLSEKTDTKRSMVAIWQLAAMVPIVPNCSIHLKSKNTSFNDMNTFSNKSNHLTSFLPLQP